MKCPKCNTETISANGGTEQFCAKCWQPVSASVALSIDPLSSDGPIRTKRSKTLRERSVVPNVSGFNGYSAARSITFELPLPPVECSPNKALGQQSRMSAIIRGKALADYRAECLGLLPPINYQAWGRMFEKASIEARFFLGTAPGRYHPRDEQNASSSIKALVDALVDAGYIIDDSAKYLHWESVDIVRPSKLACIHITLSKMTK